MTYETRFTLFSAQSAVFDISKTTARGCAKTSEVANMISSSHSTAHRLLSGLEELGSVSKLNTGNCFLWFPVEVEK